MEITEQAKLTDKELIDSLNATIRSFAKWQLSKSSLLWWLRNKNPEIQIYPKEGQEDFVPYEPTGEETTAFVKKTAQKIYDDIYSRISTDENLLKGIRAVGDNFSVDYVYRTLRDAWDSDYFENKNVVDYVFESITEKNEKGEVTLKKEEIHKMVERAIEDLTKDDVEEGGPGSGRYPAGSGKNPKRDPVPHTKGNAWYKSLSKADKATFNRGGRLKVKKPPFLAKHVLAGNSESMAKSRSEKIKRGK